MLSTNSGMIVLIITVLLTCSRGFILHHARGRVLSLATRKSSDRQKERIQVKLLQDVGQLGKRGDIVKVSAALWLNSLQPRKKGVHVSDAQLQQEAKDREVAATRKDGEAREASRIIQQLAVTIERKIGPNKKMFGTVTNSNILDAVVAALPLQHQCIRKTASITDIREIGAIGAGGNTIVRLEPGSEIRHCGEFQVTLQLGTKVDPVAFSLRVVPAT